MSWGWSRVAGRLVEISSGPKLALAFELVGQAQQRGQPAAWITSVERSFYPPDVARTGVSLELLLVVLVEEPRQAAQAALRLLASGGLGLIVLDLASFSRSVNTLPMAFLSRMVGLSRKHEAAVIVLTDKEDERASIGSLVSLRVGARPLSDDEVEIFAIKDKRHGLGWTWRARYHLPDGLS